jgi:hypothetical protein
LVAAAVAVSGCSEAWQRKFIRKKKTAAARPDPIITFEDYSKLISPLDRYRKHFLMYQYWNDELMGALKDRTPNPKRVARSSEQSLAELREMRRFLDEAAAEEFSPIIAEREGIDRQLQGSMSPAQSGLLLSQVERQTRVVRGKWFWRTVEDRVQAPAAEPSTAEPPVAEPPAAPPTEAPAAAAP